MNDFLKTPQQYIDKYSNELKKDLELYGLQINHFGFIGFILNMMGHGRFDSSFYYEHLFKEAFVASSDIDENLNLHASIFNYYPNFSIPAKAFGFLEFDFRALPDLPKNAIKREVYFGIDTQQTQFIVGNYPFTLESKYTFYQDHQEIKTIIQSKNGLIQHIPSTSTNIRVPLKEAYQYDSFQVFVRIPNYAFHSFYEYIFELEKPYLSNIKIEVKQLDSPDYVEFEYKNVKFLENESSQVAFLKKLSALKFQLEFGNGIRGLWVPNADARITIYQTNGNAGNLSRKQTVYTQEKQLSFEVTNNTNIRLVTYFDNGEIQSSFVPSTYVKIIFDHAEGGKDTSTGDFLREEIIEHIQSRINLINKIDFTNLYKKYGLSKEFRFIFKKLMILDNTFYLYHALRDEYMNIIRSTNVTIKKLLYSYKKDFEINFEMLHTTEGTLEPGSYSYKIHAIDRYGQIKTSFVNIILRDPHNTINFNWESQSNNLYYRIVGRSFTPQGEDPIAYYHNLFNQEWETRLSRFTDTGDFDFPELNFTNLELINDSMSQLKQGHYKYYISALTEHGYSKLSDIIETNIISDNQTIIKLTWNQISEISEYRITRINPDNSIVYWNVHDVNEFTDLNRQYQYPMIYDNSTVYNIQAETYQDENGTLEPGEYVYRIASSDRFGRGEVSYVGVNLHYPHNAIKLTWDIVPDAQVYYIYGRTYNNYIYTWESYNTEFYDIGNENIEIENIELELDYNTNSQLENYIYKYRIGGKTKTGYTKLSDVINVNITDSENVVKLKWDQPLNVFRYRVFREDEDGKIIYWDTYESQFTDINLNPHFVNVGTIDQDPIIGDNFVIYDFVYKPRFNIQVGLNNLEVISPFIYKYNHFMKQYDGYFMYENMITYFNKFETVDYNYIPPSIHLNIVYDHEINRTIIYIRSHQDITEHDFYIDIIPKDIIEQKMTFIDENTHMYQIYGLLEGDIQLKIQEYYIDEETNLKNIKFYAETNTFQHVVNIKDQLVLFRFLFRNEEHVVSIPCMSNLSYESNPNFYLDRIYNYMVSTNLKGNRMQTDHVQFRFLETLSLDQYFVERTFKHGHSHYHNYNILLPLKINVEVKVDNYLIGEHKIDLFEEEKKMLLEIAQYLQENASGVDLKFYRSQIIDLLHENERPWIKSVEVELKDSNGLNLNRGLETLHEDDIWKNIVDDRLQENWHNLETPEYRKLRSLQYNPVFWFWDLDDINLRIKG